MSAPAATAATTSGAKKMDQKKQQEIVDNFSKMREDQRVIATKAAELQIEQKSHELVIDTLKDAEKDRKCFRMIGGVLVERTVGEVLPALEQNREQITKLIENFQTQIVAKGKEINEYREKYNIKFQTEIDAEKKSSSDEKAKSTGVLVS